MTQLKSWFAENHTMVWALVVQAITLGGAAAGILIYAVKLENRVATMETRGAEYTVARLNVFEQRITVLEQHIKQNEESIKRIVDVMTKRLNINP